MEPTAVVSIEEVRKAKEALEIRLSEAVAEFQGKYGLMITAVEGVTGTRYVNGDPIGAAGYVGWFRVTVEL